MRLFIAIEIPYKILKGLEEVKNYLSGPNLRIRWVRLENIHLTLKFLGEVDEAMVKDIDMAMERLGESHVPFELAVRGMGCFPQVKRPRIVWAGIETDVDGVLSSIHQGLETGLEDFGFIREKRAFHPHLTLGRIKAVYDTDKWSRRLGLLKDKSFGSFIADRLCLFQSILERSGAVYTKLKEVRLAGL